jgi:hypothetical protein
MIQKTEDNFEKIKLEKEKNGYKYYDIILTAFIVLNVVTLPTAFKITDVFGFVVAGGTLVVPLIYITVGLVTEVYGKETAKRLTYLGTFCNWFFIFIMQAINFLPDNVESSSEIYNQITNFSLRVGVAGTVAYLATALSRIFLIGFLKDTVKIKSFITRNWIMILVNLALSQVLYVVLAFWGDKSEAVVVKMIWQSYVFLVLSEFFVSPITERLIAWLKKKEYEQKAVA